MRFLKQTGILLLCTLAGIVYWQWASQPLWSLEREIVRYHCHDVSRQEVVLFVRHRGEMALETRHFRTGVLIRTEALPHLEGRAVFALPNALAQQREGAIVILSQLMTTPKETLSNIRVFNRATGKIINDKPIECHPGRSHRAYGNKAAISTKDGVWLFATSDTEPRHVPMENVESADFLPGGDQVLCRSGSTLRVIDWKSGKILFTQQLPLGDLVMAFQCMPSGTILIARAEVKVSLEQMKWDGQRLVVSAPKRYLEKPLPENAANPRILGEDGHERVHIAAFATSTLHAPWRDIVPWFKAKLGLSLEKLFDKRLLFFWYVLDHQNCLLDQYEDDASEAVFLGESHLKLKSCFEKATKTHITSIVSTHPAWPNAVAVSIVLYLLIYLVRHRHRRV